MAGLSRSQTLGIAKRGVATVKRVVSGAPTSEEARYSKGRSYPPMTGVMGQFASMDAALGRINEGTADPSVHVAALEAPVVSKLTVAALSPAITPVAKLKKPTLQVAEIRDDERQLKVPRAKPSPPKAGETEDWQTALLNQHR